MRPYLILIFTIFLIGTINVKAQKEDERQLISIPLTTTYTPSEYNGGIQNWGITQDTSGYIYIANNYGLLEFDGATWNKYAIAGATKVRTVLVEEISNRIYVGGQKQLGYFEHTKSGISYHSLVDRIPSNVVVDEIWDLVAFNNEIYINVNGTLALLKNDQIKILDNVNDVEFITSIDDELLAGSTNGIYRLKQDSTTFELLENSEGHSYRGVSKWGNKYILFTYDGDIFYYENKKLKSIKTSIDSFLKTSKINKVLKLENQTIVLGTQNNGLVIIDKDLKPILHLTKNRGLNHRTVIALYEDDFNNLWVGLNNGICVVELGSPFSLINENVGLEGTGYSAAKLNDEIYLGTSSGVFVPNEALGDMDARAGYSVLTGSEGLVNSISILDKKLILGHHEGAFILNEGKIEEFSNETGFWGFKKFAKNKLIGGTYNGFFLFKNLDIPELDKSLKGLSESSRVFEFEDDSTLWMTHGYKGAYKIKFKSDSINQLSHYGSSDGFPSDILISVYKIDKELIFTAESGIYQYSQELDEFTPHPFLNEWFRNRHVSKIKQAGDRIFYIAGGELGLMQKKSIGIYESEEKQFKKINSYISDDLENINIINDDNILIGAKEGFILYQSILDKPIKDSYNTYLKNVDITNLDDELSSISGSFFESASIDSPKLIRFEYSAPFYDGLSDLKYSYRLKPYDESWSEWTNTNWKEYTNLPAKNYEFEVKSVNVYGNESKVSTYSFTINPRWYESELAYTLYSFIILVIFTSVLYTREKKHKTEKEILNLNKEKEIRSKEREIHEFSEKTNQEIQNLKNESLKKEIDHKNSQLASVTMHLLSKNEFVMSIRKKLGDALTTKDNSDNLSKIVRSIDKNIDEDEAWETFAHHFDQVHGNFLHKLKQEVKLTPQETKLCAYLKMNMSTKDIANLMNITIRGVELARYRLRKKLGISRKVNLVEFLDNY
ncbi:helix-turn-helix and ligand-binding sensor domain-containing protein [Ekhidna sp.]